MANNTTYEYFSQIYHDEAMSSASWRIPHSTGAKPAYRITVRDNKSNKNSVAYLSPEDVLYLISICPAIAAQHVMRPLRGKPFQVKEAVEFTTPMRTTQFKGLTVATLLEIGFQKPDLVVLQNTLKRDKLLMEDRRIVHGVDQILSWYEKKEYVKIREIRTRYADTDGIRKLFDSQMKSTAIHDEESKYGRVDLFYCESAEFPFLLRISQCPTSGPYFDKGQERSQQPLSMTFSIQEFIGSFVSPMYADMMNRQCD